jgi:hypothetical protein
VGKLSHFLANCDTQRLWAKSALKNADAIHWLLLFELEGIGKKYEHVKWTLDLLSELLKIDFCMKYQALS